ncbi:TetR/AcrR family transcriptional regulator [Spongiibacter sp. KMU-158]|uniref:TetR/AcrR family transcriptional regulator n=1 Tax=Spongiibacter pelagi TaxID=2760804 RepID=A0A927C1B0_9GAMM|nr:TetR/AcrR family transcriptional regulator [Spongiibacter pelagi]MBD2858909.1 TetR/AcrR family transcriptional regulator [Spongiibacter pelagi]
MNEANILESAPNLNTARPPQQARGKERFERILAAAEAQLMARSLNDFSIPDLAAELSCTRTSIYHFFPSPYAILNELTRRHLVSLEQEVEIVSKGVSTKPWRDIIDDVSKAVSGYYNAHPVAGTLILGSVASHESHQAMQLTILHLGRHVERLMGLMNITLPTNPDAKALTVEAGTACLRLSYFLHGKITPQYQQECARMMTSYLENFVEQKESSD